MPAATSLAARRVPSLSSNSWSKAGSLRTALTYQCAGSCGRSSSSGFSTIRTSIRTMRRPRLASSEFVAAGADAQRRAYTLLTNNDQILPLRKGRRIYLEGAPRMSPLYGEVVDNPADADVALLRLNAPYEPRLGGFEAMFHAGSLEFPPRTVIITPRFARR